MQRGNSGQNPLVFARPAIGGHRKGKPETHSREAKSAFAEREKRGVFLPEWGEMLFARCKRHNSPAGCDCVFFREYTGEAGVRQILAFILLLVRLSFAMQLHIIQKAASCIDHV